MLLTRAISRFFNFNKGLTLIPINTYMKQLCKSEQIINSIPENQLLNARFIKKVLKKPIKSRCASSQSGLWHGKQPQSGNQTCFSEKKTRRSWLPNMVWHKFYSQVLNRELRVSVTAKTLKCVRKYGGFDNYVIMCPPKQLDSLYGEYLRRLMLTQLNQPDLKIRKVLKSQPYIKFWTHKRTKSNGIPTIWHPKEIRHTDLSHLRVKTEKDLNPRELRQFHEINKLTELYQDIQSNHPLIKQLESQNLENNYDMEAFNKEAKEAEENFDKKMKSLNYENYSRDMGFDESQEALITEPELEGNKQVKKREKQNKKQQSLDNKKRSIQQKNKKK